MQNNTKVDTWYPGRVRTASTTAKAARCCRKGILLPSVEFSSTWTSRVNMAQPRGLSQAFLPLPVSKKSSKHRKQIWCENESINFPLAAMVNKFRNKCNFWSLFVIYVNKKCDVWGILMQVYCIFENQPLPRICWEATAINPTSFGKFMDTLKRKK